MLRGIQPSLVSALDVFAAGRAKGLQAQLQAFSVYAGGAVTLTNAYQDHTSLTTGSFTPDVNETALVELAAEFNFAGGTAPCNAGDLLQEAIDLVFSSTDHLQAVTASISATGGTGRFGITKYFVLSLTAGTAYIIKAQVQNATGNRGQAGGSQMLVWRIAA